MQYISINYSSFLFIGYIFEQWFFSLVNQSEHIPSINLFSFVFLRKRFNQYHLFFISVFYIFKLYSPLFSQCWVFLVFSLIFVSLHNPLFHTKFCIEIHILLILNKFMLFKCRINFIIYRIIYSILNNIFFNVFLLKFIFWEF